MKKLQWVGAFSGILLISVGVIFGAFHAINAAEYPSISINNGAARTDSRSVWLSLSGGEDVDDMRLSESGNFDGIVWQPFVSKKLWVLEPGSGTKRVYVQYRDTDGVINKTLYQDSIELTVPDTMSVGVTINDGAAQVSSRYVDLRLSYSSGVESYHISHTRSFTDLPWHPVTTPVSSWVLSEDEGEQTVYVEFLDANGKKIVASDTIEYVAPPRVLPAQTLVQAEDSTIYYLGKDGLLHPFLSSAVYFSWYQDFSDITEISQAKLREFMIGSPMCVRAGTWLVKFPYNPRVYAVGRGCSLYPIYSPVEAYMLYGPYWEGKILELPEYMKQHYSVVDTRQVLPGETDDDGDGVSLVQEQQYDISDLKEDSDRDWLSDYEEIFYWFTDPAKRDTDGDGYVDGREVLAGYSPLGTEALTSFPEDMFVYPHGTVVADPYSDKLYYVDQKGTYRYMGRDATAADFVTNGFQEQYIVTPMQDIDFDPISYYGIGRDNALIQHPVLLVGSQIFSL